MSRASRPRQQQQPTIAASQLIKLRKANLIFLVSYKLQNYVIAFLLGGVICHQDAANATFPLERRSGPKKEITDSTHTPNGSSS